MLEEGAGEGKARRVREEKRGQKGPTMQSSSEEEVLGEWEETRGIEDGRLEGKETAATSLRARQPWSRC